MPRRCESDLRHSPCFRPVQELVFAFNVRPAILPAPNSAVHSSPAYDAGGARDSTTPALKAWWSSSLRLPCCWWQTHGVTGGVGKPHFGTPTPVRPVRSSPGPCATCPGVALNEEPVSRTASRRVVEMKHSIIFLLGARRAERSVEPPNPPPDWPPPWTPEFLSVLTLTGGRAGCAGTGTESPADHAAADGFANNRRPIGDRIITSHIGCLVRFGPKLLETLASWTISRVQ